mgnify:CR=1 FL=1
MTRLVVFCLFLVGLAAVMNLRDYSTIEVDNSRFDYEKKKAEHEAHVKERKELELQYAQAIKPKVVSDEVVIELSLIHI